MEWKTGVERLFTGKWNLDRPLAPAHYAYLKKYSSACHAQYDEKEIAKLRDPARNNVGLPVGFQGCYYVDEEFDVISPTYWLTPPGQDIKNTNGENQHLARNGLCVPSIWCEWEPSKKGDAIVFNERSGEFDNFIEWIRYLIEHFFAVWKYKLNGDVQWQEISDDEKLPLPVTGVIRIIDNKVTTIPFPHPPGLNIRPDACYEKYETWDNGGHPFVVFVEDATPRMCEQYRRLLPLLHNALNPEICADALVELICEFASTQLIHVYLGDRCPLEHFKSYDDIVNVFVGESCACEEDSPCRGNSVLLERLDRRFVFVGERIYEFSTCSEAILKYYSQVGRNAIPYPVAVGKHNVYMMLNNGFVPKSLFAPNTDWMHAYDQYYGHEPSAGNIEREMKVEELQNFNLVREPFNYRV